MAACVMCWIWIKINHFHRVGRVHRRHSKQCFPRIFSGSQKPCTLHRDCRNSVTVWGCSSSHKVENANANVSHEPEVPHLVSGVQTTPEKLARVAVSSYSRWWNRWRGRWKWKQTPGLTRGEGEGEAAAAASSPRLVGNLVLIWMNTNTHAPLMWKRACEWSRPYFQLFVVVIEWQQCPSDWFMLPATNLLLSLLEVLWARSNQEMPLW